MKKLILVTFFSVSALLTGCETGNHLNNMRTSEKPLYSCEQIYGGFKAYEFDRQSATALAALSGLIPVDANIDTSSNAYFQRLKMAANVALISQGCQPLA